MKKLNVGIIGCGAITESSHLPSLFKIQDCEVVALCDINEQRSDYLGQKYNIEKHFLDYKEINSLDTVDAVIIATNSPAHFEIALDAIKNDKAVFIEKPITSSVEDAKKICKEYNKKKNTVMVGYQLRYLPNHRIVKKLIDDKKIGQVRMRHIRAETLVIKPEETLLIDYGTHFFDLIRWYTNRSKIVKVNGSLNLNKKGEQIGVSSLLQFEDDTHALIEMSWLPDFSWGVVDRSFEALGNKGKIWTKMSGPDIRLWRSNSTRDKLLGPQTFLPPEASIKYAPLSDYCYYKEMDSFVKKALKKEPAEITPEDGLAALQIADLTKKDAEKGGEIEI